MTHHRRRRSRRHHGGRHSFDTTSYKSARSNSFNTDSFESAIGSSPHSASFSPGNKIKHASHDSSFGDENGSLGVGYYPNESFEEKTMANTAKFINKENEKEDKRERWYHKLNPFRSRPTKKIKQMQQFYAKDGTFEDEEDIDYVIPPPLKSPPSPPSPPLKSPLTPKKSTWWSFWRKNTDNINQPAPTTKKRRKFWPWKAGGKRMVTHKLRRSRRSSKRSG